MEECIPDILRLEENLNRFEIPELNRASKYFRRLWSHSLSVKADRLIYRVVRDKECLRVCMLCVQMCKIEEPVESLRTSNMVVTFTFPFLFNFQ